MDWEDFKCGNPECEVQHWRYFDQESDEIFGIVDARGGGFVAFYKGDVIGEFRRSDSAMARVQKVHDEGGLKEGRRRPDAGTFVQEILAAVQQAIPGFSLERIFPPAPALPPPPVGWVGPMRPGTWPGGEAVSNTPADAEFQES